MNGAQTPFLYTRDLYGQSRLFIYLVFFIPFLLLYESSFDERMCANAAFDANVYRFVLLMLVSSLLLRLEFRNESFYSRQSSNIVHEATHYIGRYASKSNDPNSPIASNKTRGKQIATNQSKSKTNLIYAIRGYMRPTQFLLHKAVCFLCSLAQWSTPAPCRFIWLLSLCF